MSPYDPAIKASIRRRIAKGKTLVHAFHGLKTELWRDELRLEKAIEVLKQKARQEKRALTGAEKNDIRGWNGGISMSRSRRLAADSLELSGWDSAQDDLALLKTSKLRLLSGEIAVFNFDTRASREGAMATRKIHLGTLPKHFLPESNLDSAA